MLINKLITAPSRKNPTHSIRDHMCIRIYTSNVNVLNGFIDRYSISIVPVQLTNRYKFLSSLAKWRDYCTCQSSIINAICGEFHNRQLPLINISQRRLVNTYLTFLMQSSCLRYDSRCIYEQLEILIINSKHMQRLINSISFEFREVINRLEVSGKRNQSTIFTHLIY